MANEITTTVSITVDKGDFRQSFAPGPQRIDWTGTEMESGSTTIGTASSGQQITSGLLTNGGYFYARNTGADNTIDIGRSISSVFQPFLALPPGESVVARLDSSDVYAKATGGSSTLQWAVFSP